MGILRATLPTTSLWTIAALLCYKLFGASHHLALSICTGIHRIPPSLTRLHTPHRFFCGCLCLRRGRVARAFVHKLRRDNQSSRLKRTFSWNRNKKVRGSAAAVACVARSCVFASRSTSGAAPHSFSSADAAAARIICFPVLLLLRRRFAHVGPAGKELSCGATVAR